MTTYLDSVMAVFRFVGLLVAVAILIFGPLLLILVWLDIVERGMPLRWVGTFFLLLVWLLAIAALPLVGVTLLP